MKKKITLLFHVLLLCASFSCTASTFIYIHLRTQCPLYASKIPSGGTMIEGMSVKVLAKNSQVASPPGSLSWVIGHSTVFERSNGKIFEVQTGVMILVRTSWPFFEVMDAYWPKDHWPVYSETIREKFNGSFEYERFGRKYLIIPQCSSYVLLP